MLNQFVDIKEALAVSLGVQNGGGRLTRCLEEHPCSLMYPGVLGYVFIELDIVQYQGRLYILLRASRISNLVLALLRSAC